jgi:Coenzyme PQQ synthesis protein D (PqqD)
MRFRPSEDVVSRAVDPETVILDMREGQFHVARGVGPRVWELLAGGASVDDVAHEVAGRYGRPENEVARDVEAFAAACREHNLLVELPETPA